jgi:hypothetical protein
MILLYNLCSSAQEALSGSSCEVQRLWLLPVTRNRGRSSGDGHLFPVSKVNLSGELIKLEIKTFVVSPKLELRYSSTRNRLRPNALLFKS